EVDDLTNSLKRILASLKIALLRTGLSKEELGLTPEEAIKAKKESEYTSKKYLNLARAIVVALDEDANIDMLNDYGYDVLGYKKGSLIGKNWFDFVIKKKDRDKVKDVFKKVMREEEVVESYENELIKKSGKKIIIRWHNSILRDENSQVTGTISYGENITKISKFQKNIEKSNAKLKSFLSLSSDREEKMLELKKEIKKLKRENDKLKKKIK
ncbi:PAS domain-containing protein, partial [Candidatus Woesearchaeota archaeon]|nr:PAS domain-containing protein [Candidatus Woesearchaeota archaeon]